MSIKRNEKLKIISICNILTIILVGMSTVFSNAQGNLESEFSSVINKYNQENVIVENGISLRLDETLDLSEFTGWKMSNNEIVKVDDSGIVHPINSGTVFLSNEINGNIHVVEIYVPDNYTRYNLKSTSVNRDTYKVFVDAGHGGNDNGASGNGYLEDELNLQVAKKVENILTQKGIEVRMSRTSDVYLSLGERAKHANMYGADLFVSIHQNSAASSSASGIETYYHTNKTNHKSYSQEIQKRAISLTNAKDRGIKSENFAVLRETNMPASLFESGFITNKDESKKLASPAYQDKLASAIANGVEKYLKDNIVLVGDENDNGIAYQTHIQDYGWQPWKSNGKMSGTEGQSKRLESIKIKLNNMIPGANISYRTHVEDYGWQQWKRNGEISGTIGESKRLEAIEIKLENAPGYKVEYRVHVEDYGWQPWKLQGEVSGTIGESKRLEGIEIRIVKEPSIEYRTHVQDYGWQSWKSNGEMSGTSEQSKRLEAIEINVSGLPNGANILYQTHIQDYGWENWKSNGESSGTTGESKRLEAIRVKLENAPSYNVEYRTHIEGIGWQEWKSQGEISGTEGESRRLEAIEVKVIKN